MLRSLPNQTRSVARGIACLVSGGVRSSLGIAWLCTLDVPVVDLLLIRRAVAATVADPDDPATIRIILHLN